LEGLGGGALSSLGYSLETNGNGPLSVPFLLKLASDSARLLSRLPLHSVVHELLSRRSLADSTRPGLIQRIGQNVRATVSKMLSWIPALAQPGFRALTDDSTSRPFPVRLTGRASHPRVSARLEK